MVKKKRSEAQDTPAEENLNQTVLISTKSERNAQDSHGAMGMGATNIVDRVAARIGILHGGVDTEFHPAKDISKGGVLCAIPSLLAIGLFHKTEEHFSTLEGYYRLEHIFLVLATMALCRQKSVESLRYVAVGEWGKLLGLDRIPEVRTLRSKIQKIVAEGKSQQWSAELCTSWMAAAPEDAMVLYVDGHVRVYHGNEASLPKHYVPRQRLCVAATTDYWVNAMDGQPFFVVNQPIDPGLIKVLEETIIPRLCVDVPHQPSKQELERDPLLHRFTVIFDREGYSPDLFMRLKKQCIAVHTYRKYAQDPWPEDEFVPMTVTLASGEDVTMHIAERGVYLAKKLWVREVRRLTESGHQTAIVSTDYRSDSRPLAAQMFARWSQENFFRYMREQYGLDKLSENLTGSISETTRVVNPAYRAIDGKVRKKVAILQRQRAEFGAIIFQDEIGVKNANRYERKKSTLKDDLECLEKEVFELKATRKATARYITVKELPEKDRIKPLAYSSKHFIDTIKMIAYRAETAMANILKNTMSRPSEARCLLQNLYQTDADIVPNPSENTLTIYLHRLANHSNDNAIQSLFSELNATNTFFPGTNLRMILKWGSADFR